MFIRSALPLLLLSLPLTACGDEEKPPDPGSASTRSSDRTPSVECTYVAGGPSAKDVEVPPASPRIADSLVLKTNQGDIPVQLDAEGAPCTAGSFTSLARQGYFDDTECHRLTTSGIFVLQCGDPSATGAGGPGYQFPDELTGGETYPAGTLAMANAGPDTNGSQFFIVYEDTPLPPSYTVFGRIDEVGLKVVREVANAGSDDTNGPGDGAPQKKVVIESVS